MIENKLTGLEAQGMVRHWLSVPPNGYLGSGYGSDPHQLLQKPNSDSLGDALLAKMRTDIPVIDALQDGAVNLYLQDMPDGNGKRLLVEVLNSLVTVDNLRNIV
jgi:hypothetical protein